MLWPFIDRPNFFLFIDCKMALIRHLCYPLFQLMLTCDTHLATINTPDRFYPTRYACTTPPILENGSVSTLLVRPNSNGCAPCRPPYLHLPRTPNPKHDYSKKKFLVGVVENEGHIRLDDNDDDGADEI